MTVTIYAFATIGFAVSVRWVVIGVRQFWKDLHSKPTPWLGLPWGPG